MFRAPREDREPARSTERHELVKGLLRGPQRPIHRALAAGVWGSVQGPRPAWDSPQRGQLTPPPHLWEGVRGSRGCGQAQRALGRHLPAAERPHLHPSPPDPSGVPRPLRINTKTPTQRGGPLTWGPLQLCLHWASSPLEPFPSPATPGVTPQRGLECSSTAFAHFTCRFQPSDGSPLLRGASLVLLTRGDSVHGLRSWPLLRQHAHACVRR